MLVTTHCPPGGVSCKLRHGASGATSSIRRPVPEGHLYRPASVPALLFSRRLVPRAHESSRQSLEPTVSPPRPRRRKRGAPLPEESSADARKLTFSHFDVGPPARRLLPARETVASHGPKFARNTIVHARSKTLSIPRASTRLDEENKGPTALEPRRSACIEQNHRAYVINY